MTFPTKDTFTFDYTTLGDYPSWTPAQTKINMNARSEEMRVALNALIGALNSTGTDNWIYQQIIDVVAGGIADNSLDDNKLSNEAGQVKDRLATNIVDYTAFKGTKAQASGLASLDSGGHPVEKPYVVGTYTGDNSASRNISIGFRPSAVLVMNRYGQTTVQNSDVAAGLAIDGFPASWTVSATEYKIVEINATGFAVANVVNAGGGTVDLTTNNSGTLWNPYRYIAFR